MRMVRRILSRSYCNLKAIPYWIKTGCYEPHVFVELPIGRRDIYISTNGKFRIARGSMNPNEHLVKNVLILKRICKDCGKIEYAFE